MIMLFNFIIDNLQTNIEWNTHVDTLVFLYVTN